MVGRRRGWERALERAPAGTKHVATWVLGWERGLGGTGARGRARGAGFACFGFTSLLRGDRLRVVLCYRGGFGGLKNSRLEPFSFCKNAETARSYSSLKSPNAM